MSFIGSTVTFTTAFGLETLVYSQQIWTKISVGFVFAMVMLLIAWCVWTTTEGNKFRRLWRFLSSGRRLFGLPVRPRGNIHEPRQDVRDCGNGNENQSGTCKDIKLTRRRRGVSASEINQEQASVV